MESVFARALITIYIYIKNPALIKKAGFLIVSFTCVIYKRV